MLKIRNLQTSRVNISRILKIKNAKFSGYCEIFRVLFLYEHKDVGIFSNLLYCTFKNTVKNQNNEKYCYKID